MSVEKIINQIQEDSQKEVNQIIKDAEIHSKKIINEYIEKAKKESKDIIENGKKQSDGIKKILISKASQDAKRAITKSREKIIEDCFNKAQDKLNDLKGKEYENFISNIIKDSIKKIGKNFSVLYSREEDKKIIQKLGFKSTGKVESSGGVIIISNDGKIKLDNTFEGILKRRKDQIRLKVGKLLFS